LPQCGKLHPDEIGELTVKRQTIGNMLCASYYSVSRRGSSVNQKLGNLRSLSRIGMGDTQLGADWHQG